MSNSKIVEYDLNNSPAEILEFVRHIKTVTAEREMEDKEGLLKMLDDVETLVTIVIKSSEICETRGLASMAKKAGEMAVS